jgi:hypothetical protein
MPTVRSAGAVVCWHQDPLAAMSWRPEPPAPTRVEAWLSETLAGRRMKYPDVVAHPAVIREHAVADLVLASAVQTCSLSATAAVTRWLGRCSAR